MVLEQVPGENRDAREAKYVEQLNCISGALGLSHLTDLHVRRNEKDRYFLQNTHYQLYKKWFLCDGREAEAHLEWLQRGLLQIINTSSQQLKN
jgi:hypothetical protein